MWKSTTVLCWAALCGGLLIAGCAAPVKEGERTGFISDYSKLGEEEGKGYTYVSDGVADYAKFLIDPVTMLYHPPEGEEPEFTDEELDELTVYFREKIEEALTRDEGYELVTEPGPGVARFRAAITQVDETVGVLNILLYTRITGAGLGGAAMEAEIVDSLSGEQLAAVVRWGSGRRVLRAGLTRFGDAKILIKRWTRDIRKRIDEKHGIE